MQNAVRNRCLFLRWLHRDFPDVYNAAMERVLADERTDGMSDWVESISGMFDSLSKSVPVIAETYGKIKSQIDWMKINIERARHQPPLPPLDPATGLPLQSSEVPAPPPGTPAAAAETKVAASAPAPPSVSGIPTWAIIAGAAVGLGALLLG